jgi:hypothetical protein
MSNAHIELGREEMGQDGESDPFTDAEKEPERFEEERSGLPEEREQQQQIATGLSIHVPGVWPPAAGEAAASGPSSVPGRPAGGWRRWRSPGCRVRGR